MPTHSSLRGIERLLRPKSIAVLGASATPGALGASVVVNIDRFNFAGDLFLINPNRESIGSRKCLKSVDQLPLGVDVAILAIPRAAVLQSVKSLSERQVGAAIIFSAGFAEGGESGLADQRELARIAADTGLIIEGPNCLGLVNYVDGIALTFVETSAILLGERPGIGIVSQSGAMAAVLAVTLTSKQLGISYSISTGNEAASGIEDYVAFLVDDPQTQVIALVVEQFRKPPVFLELARLARQKAKPIVLLHPGRSIVARESAATHTGALAGDYNVMCMRVEREGVLVAQTLEEFGDILDIILRCRPRPSGGTAVLTESGAFKALTLDFCEDINLPLPVITDETAPVLRAALPDFVPVSNPVDLTAQGLVDPDLYRRSLEALLDDDRFGCIILGIILSDAKTCAIKFPSILNGIRQLAPQKAVIFAGLDDGALVPEEYISELRELGVPYFPSPGRAYRAVARICNAPAAASLPRGAEILIPSLNLSTSGMVAEYRSKELLTPLGIAFPVRGMAKTLPEAKRIGEQLGYPVVLKAQSAALPHKSDAGGVILNVKDTASMDESWSRLQANIANSKPGLVLDGVLIERMSKPGVELIIGGRNDESWGPMVLVGFGGVHAEILKDVRLLPANLSLNEIIAQVLQLKSAILLRGFRGSPALDVPAVARMIQQLAALLSSEPSVREIDLNPVIVYPLQQGAIALDALMVIDES